jgi:hypothetical protein
VTLSSRLPLPASSSLKFSLHSTPSFLIDEAAIAASRSPSPDALLPHRPNC